MGKHLGSLLAMTALAGVCFAAADGSGAGGGADRSAQIKDALSRLDTTSDDDWTQGGLPDMARMKALTGLEDLTRAEVAGAVPGFDRGNAASAPSDLSNAGTSDASKNAGPTGDGGGENQGNGGDNESELKRREELTKPNLDPESNPNVGQDLGPYEGQAHTADQKELLREQIETERKGPTAQELADHFKDPILLLEAAVAAANASDRHRRNGPLHQIVRHFMVDQVAIKDHQARLDKRDEQREGSAG